MITIELAKEFSRYPAGRYLADGPYSGEKFREEYLLPNVRKGEKITIVFDGAMGYGSSFLEEAFGGLVRELGDKELVLNCIVFVSEEDPYLVSEIKSYIEQA